MANVITKKLLENLSRRVLIIFRLNFQTFFWRDIFSLYLLLQFLLSNVFPKEPSISYVILVATLRIISPRRRHSEQVFSIVSGLLLVFPRNLLKDLLDRACEISVVFFFDIAMFMKLSLLTGCIHSVEVG